MSLLFPLVSLLFTASESADATVYCHMDNYGTISVSHDDGVSYTDVGSETYWPNELSVTIPDVTASTIIQFTVGDQGGVGGFIANVAFEGTNYVTTDQESSLFEFVTASDGDMNEVFVKNGNGAWGSYALGGNIPADAYWVWNKGTWNTLVFAFSFDALISRLPSATVSTHIDNSGVVSVSYDDGATWSLIGSTSDWTNELVVDVDDITDATIIRFQCSDVGSIGGFIANVEFEGTDYPTSDPIASNYYELVSASDGEYDLTYTLNGNGAWGSYAKGGNIPSTAYWVWNGQTYNSLTFDFRFDIIVDGGASALCEAKCETMCEKRQSKRTTRAAGSRRTSSTAATTSVLSANNRVMANKMMYLNGALEETLNYSAFDGFMFGFVCSSVLSMVVFAIWYYWYYKPRKGLDYSELN